MKDLRRFRTGIVLAVIGALTMLTQVGSAADDRDHPGYVDGSGLVNLADEDGNLVEVTLSRRMLKLFSRRAVRRHDGTLADLLADLEAVNAIVAELDDRYMDVAQRDIERIRRRVEDDGWERFVRVRNGGEEEFAAYIHLDREDEVDGLLVIGFTGGSELIFVNLVGRIDMERVAIIGERFGMPGLDALPPASEMNDWRSTHGNDIIRRRSDEIRQRSSENSNEGEPNRSRRRDSRRKHGDAS